MDITGLTARGIKTISLPRWLTNGLISVWLAVVILLGGVGGILRTVILFLKGPQPIDFNTLYLAGRMLLKDPQSIYNASALADLEKAAQSTGSVFQVHDWAPPFAYPPFVAVALRPLTTLPHETAVWIWLILNLSLLLLTLPMLLSLIHNPDGNLELQRLSSRTAILAFLLFVPAFESVMLGQVGPVLLFLCTAALVLLRRGRGLHDYTAGFLLGLAAMIKIFPGVLLIYILFRRRWKALAGGIAGLLITTLIGILGSGGLSTGWQISWDYFTSGLFKTYTARFAFLQPGNQAITAWLIRLLGETPLVHAITLLTVFLVFLITWITVLKKSPSFSRDTFLYQYAMVSLLFLLVPSTVFSNYFIIALLTIEMLIGITDLHAEFPTKAFNGLLGVAYLLLIFSSYADWLKWPVFYIVPFGLIGISILWGLLAWVLRAPHGKTKQAINSDVITQTI